MGIRNREQEAVHEVNATTVSRRVAAWLVAVFLGVVWLPFAGQLASSLKQPGHDASTGDRVPVSLEILPLVRRALRPVPDADGNVFTRVIAANRRLRQAFDDYEERLKDTDWLARALRPPVVRTMFVWFRHAGEKVYVGRKGWLFYRADVDSVYTKGFLDPTRLEARAMYTDGRRPHPDPRPAILGFRDQLAQRGIRLILLPVPVKPVILPGRLAAGTEPGRAVHNVSFAAFIDEMRAAGVMVLDAGPILASFESAEGIAPYLKTDTHWRPEALDRVAKMLADNVRLLLSSPEDDGIGLNRVPAPVSNRGDIVRLLGFDAAGTSAEVPPETVTVQEVHDEYGALWQPTMDADVLLLGDSFTNIYSLDGMGWGRGGGLAEQLSYHLGRPVDRIVRNDDGASATRRTLAHELAAGRDRLAKKKVVIWQFASRELCYGNWAPVDLSFRPAPAQDFLTVPAGIVMSITGTIAAVSPVPAPGTVPYKDHVRAVHLVDITAEDADTAGSQAVVYLESMRGNVWTAAAGLRVGDGVRLRLRAWADVADTYESVNRTELEDVNLQLREPCWGVIDADATNGVERHLTYAGWTTWGALIVVLICAASRGIHAAGRCRASKYDHTGETRP